MPTGLAEDILDVLDGCEPTDVADGLADVVASLCHANATRNASSFDEELQQFQERVEALAGE